MNQASRKMVLYKYKSVEYIEDIIHNRRLFCSKFDNLNDPMEWAFTSNENRDEIKKLINETDKESWRICCLSKSEQYGLMWSMYGDSHRGVCIEVEVDLDDVAGEKVSHINEYKSAQWIWGDIKYCLSPDNLQKIERVDVARVLWTKSKQWEHEQEVRFVRCLDKKDATVYLPVKVKTIFLGKKMDTNEVSRIIELCKKAGIQYVCMNSDNAPQINYWKNFDGNDF